MSVVVNPLETWQWGGTDWMPLSWTPTDLDRARDAYVVGDMDVEMFEHCVERVLAGGKLPDDLRELEWVPPK